LIDSVEVSTARKQLKPPVADGYTHAMSQPTKIAINGFGRIGRKIARLALDPSLRRQIEIVAINDLGSIEQLAHLFKYDSVHRPFEAEVRVEGDRLFVGDTSIRVTSERDPKQLPWKELGVDVVHECTGAFTKGPLAAQHLEAGAKKVLISAPAVEPDATLCMGVNHESYDPSNHRVISNASCTTNCLAPLAKVLDDNFGLVRGTMLTVHSYTADQRLLDLPHKDFRRMRAAAISQIPTSTGAAKAVGLVLPQLKGKLDGLAIRVPTPNVSMVDLTCELGKKTSKEEINAAFKSAAEGPLKGILGYEETPLVSSDYYGDTRSSILDAPLTSVLDGNFVKVLSWYDNESGFSQRMIDLTLEMASKGL
jgi:glyceraldehyde 3-phosphate dehydrogenase